MMETLRKEKEKDRHLSIIERVEMLELSLSDSMDKAGKTRKDQMRRTMETLFNNNAGVEMRMAFAGWVQVLKILRKEHKKEWKESVTRDLELLGFHFDNHRSKMAEMDELMKFHKMSRKDQMRKSLELMFNNNKSVEMRVAFAGWQQMMETLKKERQDEKHLS